MPKIAEIFLFQTFIFFNLKFFWSPIFLKCIWIYAIGLKITAISKIQISGRPKGYFNCFQNTFGLFQEILRLLQGTLTGNSVCFKVDNKMFHGCFMGVLILFQGCFKEVQRFVQLAISAPVFFDRLMLLNGWT